jgi:Protein of unknown function (DUF3575)
MSAAVFRVTLVLVLAAAALTVQTRPAAADDAAAGDGGDVGDAGDGGVDDAGAGCTDDAGNPCDAGTGAPLACDGALCDTSNSAACSVSVRGSGEGARVSACAMALCLGVALVARARRRRRSALVAGVVAGACSLGREAAAEPPAPVDVTIVDAPPPTRVVALEWNPLPLFTLGKLSANVIVVPVAHHALVVSPFYASSTTAAIYVYDDAGNPTQLPVQKFTGYGAELGYRYYFGDAGPRGLFMGPSLVLGAFEATAQNGETTPYVDYGVAVDVGYQMLVADRVSLSLGGGLQYTTPSKTIPAQQYPADVFANRALRPRFLLSIGWAL